MEVESPYSRENDEFYQATYEICQGNFTYEGKSYPYEVTARGLFGDGICEFVVYTNNEEISFDEILQGGVGQSSSIYDYSRFRADSVLVSYE